MSGLDQRVLFAPDDGSLGPLLRISDDRLAPGAAYGRHEHRAVDVVALLVSGALRHRWAGGAQLWPGDVAVLRSGAGLEHDEVAGNEGARVLQCYLRAADPGAVPTYEVHPSVAGWLDLGRDDARLWVARGVVAVPAGLPVPVEGSDLRMSWQLVAARPDWARD